MFAVLALLALVAPLPANAVFRLAVDISQLGTSSAFSCLRTYQYNTVFVRAYKPDNGGSPDYNAPTNVKAASAAGLGVEVFAVPAPTSFTSAIKQIDDTITTLQNYGVTVRSLWLQVTSPVNWSANQNQNINFIQSAVQRIRARNVRPGIYTSQYDWNQITNGFSNLGSDVMLWYWHVFGAGPSGESPQNFNDFRSFAQWSSPMVKQFGQQESLCGFSFLNRDVYQGNGMADNSNATSVSSTNIVVGGIGLDTPLN